MARARNIKPSFFMNEELIDLGFGTRLLFIGLWTLADREGRLENRPKRIKMALFPADEMNIPDALNELVNKGFLSIYTTCGVDVIQIVNFIKHQSPHGLEKDSELPDQNGLITVWERTEKGFSTKKSTLRDLKKPVLKPVQTSFDGQSSQPENSTDTSIEPVETSFNTGLEPDKTSFETVSDSGKNLLIPDCGILIPDSLNHESSTHTQNACDEVSPDLEQLNIRIKTAGYPEITQEYLNKELIFFNDHYETWTLLTENQRLGKLAKWMIKKILDDRIEASKKNSAHTGAVNVQFADQIGDKPQSDPAKDAEFEAWKASLPEGV